VQKLYMQDDNASIKRADILDRKTIRACFNLDLFRPKAYFLTCGLILPRKTHASAPQKDIICRVHLYQHASAGAEITSVQQDF
jgi:hypothetical protein